MSDFNSDLSINLNDVLKYNFRTPDQKVDSLTFGTLKLQIPMGMAQTALATASDADTRLATVKDEIKAARTAIGTAKTQLEAGHIDQFDYDSIVEDLADLLEEKNDLRSVRQHNRGFYNAVAERATALTKQLS